MRRKNLRSRGNKKKKVNKKSIQLLNIQKTRWISRAKKYTPYPCLVVISIHSRNVFFNITDHAGQTYFWTSAGRYGFRGRDRKQFMAIREMTNRTFDVIHNSGIKRTILVLKNHYRSNTFAIKHGIKNSLKKRRSRIKIIS